MAAAVAAKQLATLADRVELIRLCGIVPELIAANHGLQLQLQEADQKMAATMVENDDLQITTTSSANSAPTTSTALPPTTLTPALPTSTTTQVTATSLLVDRLRAKMDERLGNGEARGVIAVAPTKAEAPVPQATPIAVISGILPKKRSVLTLMRWT